MESTTKTYVSRVILCSLLAGMSLSIVGCKKKEKNTAIGTVLGAGAGAGIGAAAGGGAGAGVGAVVGGVTGGVLGNVLTEDEDEK